MAVDPRLRRRVERLLGGNFSSEDLANIFLIIRHRDFGRESIREIGDFIAHADVRVKGPCTSITRDFAVWARFLLPSMLGRGQKNMTAEELGTLLHAQLRNFSDELILREFGLSRSQALSLLTAGLRRVDRVVNGVLVKKQNLKPSQASLMSGLQSRVVYREPINPSSLLEDFTYVLERCDALKANEVAFLSPIKDRLALYAMVCMHLCRIRLGTDDLAILKLGHTDRKLAVAANFTVGAPDHPQGLAIEMFSSDLHPGVHTARLFHPDDPNTACWDEPLSLSEDGIIRPI